MCTRNESSSELVLKRIKSHRELKGLTQKAMAEKIGVPESFYCQLEGGKRKLSIDYAIRIVHTLSVTLDEIFLDINFAKREENVV